MLIKTIMGLEFECPSPSVLHMKDEAITLAFDGHQWRMSLLDSDNVRREGTYPRRDAAIKMLATAFGTLTQVQG